MSGPFKRHGRPSREADERFGELYEDTSRDLLVFLLRRCATAEDAADCLAETYRIAWEKRTRIPAGSQGRPWLFGVARNVVREERRHDERQAATSHTLALAAESYYEQPTLEDSALMTALSVLSPLDQEIFLMLSADGLPPREVAKVFGLSPNAVSIRGHRARTKLRSLLARDQPDEEPPFPDAAPITASHAP